MGKLLTSHVADHIVKALVSTMGGRRSDWAELVGSVEPLSSWHHEHSNWEVYPVASSGTDLDAIRAAVALVRVRYPYVDG